MISPWHIDMRGKLNNWSCKRVRRKLYIQEAIAIKEALDLIKLGVIYLKDIRDGGE